jgi:hypothetical protein
MNFAAMLNADVRYSFTGQFLEAATLFAQRARLIEGKPDAELSEELRAEHRGLVSAAVMQCAAALETEAGEICVYGPGSHLGSNGTNHLAQQFLSPLADIIDHQETLRRFELILHLLRLPAIEKGSEPYRSAALVVRLRNETTHYKSKWGQDMESSKLFASLKSLGHNPPPFISPKTNFFPHQCLSADCAAWAVNSTVAFLDAVYDKLGVPSRFETFRSRVTP